MIAESPARSTRKQRTGRTSPSCNALTLIDVVENLRLASPQTGVHFEPDQQDNPVFLSYHELYKRVSLYARSFQEQGITIGSRVIVPFETHQDVLCAFFGLMTIGAIPLSIKTPQATGGRISYVEFLLEIVQRYRAPRILGVPSLTGLYHPIQVLNMSEPLQSACKWEPPYRPSPDNIAFVQLSSGTTGFPKGVPIRHDRCLQNLKYIVNTDQRNSRDIGAGWLPLYHDMGLIGLLSNFFSLNTVHISTPMNYLIDPMRWWSALSEFHGTVTVTPNFGIDFALRRLREMHPSDLHGLDLSSIKCIYLGSEPINMATLNEFCERMAVTGLRQQAFTACYGMSEAVLMVSSDGLHDVIRAHSSTNTQYVCVGRLLPSFDVRITTEAGTLAKEGELGEIELRAGTMADGYFESNLPFFNEDGFYETGDLGMVLNGELYIGGRIGDRMKVNGQSFFATAFEHIVESLPFVRVGHVVVFQQDERIVVLIEMRRSDKGRPQQHLLRSKVVKALLAQTGVKVFAEDVKFIRGGQLLKTSSGKMRRRAICDKYTRGEIQQLS